MVQEEKFTNRKLILILLTLILSSGVCLADNYVGGIPLTSVQSGTVDGGVYFDSYYGTGTQEIHTVKTIDKTFTLPADADVEWAMLLTTVYCGHMQNNYQGTANVSFNGQTLGNETLNVPFTYISNGGDGYVQVNDHVNRVTSDYMMYYDVTNLVKAGENRAVVNTAPLDNSFDGRVKLITLVVAYNDGSGNRIWYQVNRGHDADTYYSDDELGEDYKGSTAFEASLPEGASLADAELTVVHMASTDGTYNFNGNKLASGTPQGTYTGSNTWDVKDYFNSGTNMLTYDRAAGFYKNALGILTAEYAESQVSAPVADFSANVTGGTEPLTVQFTDASTGTISSYAWDFNNDGSIDSTAQNPSYTYTSAGTYTVNLTVTNAGGSDSEVKAGYITVKAAATNDLTISGIVNTVPSSAVFAREPNSVKVNTIKNTGSSAITNIPVALYASDVSSTVPVNTTTIESLAGGGSTSVTLIDPTIRSLEGGTVTYTAVVDPDNLISETNETNNNKKSASKYVKYNGYKGKRYWEGGSDITTKHEYDLHGNLLYSTQPESAYRGVGWTTRTETWSASDLPVPSGSTIEKVFLYFAYNWDQTPGGYPWLTLNFNGNILDNGNLSTGNGNLYRDWSNFGSYPDYEYGLCVYDVTDKFSSEGNSLVTNPYDSSYNKVALYPSTLVVIYRNPYETRKQIFINEECDELGLSESSYATTLEEATAYAPFTGLSIDRANVTKAMLYSFAGSAGPEEGNLLFNGNTVATDVWGGSSNTASPLVFNATNYISETGNEAGIQGTTSGGMVALQQILVIEYPADAPIAAFTATPTSGDAPLTVQFTDASTGIISLYAWDFNNDGKVDSTEQNPSYTYASAGTYAVNLTVSGPGGSDSEVKTEYIVVSEPLPEAPVAAFTATPTSGDAPLTVNFTDQSTGVVSYYSWDFDNDGTADSTEQSPSYTYVAAGTYTVKLTVTNARASDEEVKAGYITVSTPLPELPVADFSANITSGDAPLEVQFTDASTGTISSYAWDFNNDGTVDSTEQSPSYTYESAGTYSVSLTVSNAGGSDSEVKTGYIVVSEPLPGAPVAAFTATPLAGTAPLSVTFADQSTNSPTSWNWEYNNGSGWVQFSTEKNPTCSFDTACPYDIRLTATNSGGSDDETKLHYIAVATGREPLTTIQTGNVSGDLYFSSPTTWVSSKDTWVAHPELNLTFNLPAAAVGNIEWAKLYVNTYSGSAGNNYALISTVKFDGNGDSTFETTLGSETMDIASENNANSYPLNDHVNKVFSDYEAQYDVTSLISAVNPAVNVKEQAISGKSFDGRIKGITLVVAYNDPASTNQTYYWVNHGGDWISTSGSGLTTFDTEGLTSGWVSAESKIRQVSTKDATIYTFNGVSKTGGNNTPNYDGLNTWDVTNDIISGQSSTLVYSNPAGSSYKTTLATLKVKYVTPPVAAFTATPTSGDSPLDVKFTDESAGSPTSWAWDFNNDGNVDSTEQSPSYTYTSAGIYSVTLTVTSAGGTDSETKTDYITVSSPETPDTTKPVIESVVLFPANTTAGSTIEIKVSATDDVEVIEVKAGDIQLINTDGIWKGSITAPSSPGDYSLQITAKDAAGNTVETSVPYHVVQLSGGANIAVSPRSSSVTAGNTVSLSIKVKNTQNIDDTFKVHLSVSELPASYQAGLSWFNWTEKVVTLKAGEEILVPVEIAVPEGTAAGRKLFRANVNSETSSITGFDTGYLAIS